MWRKFIKHQQKKIGKSKIGDSKTSKVLKIVESQKQTSKINKDEILTYEEIIFVFIRWLFNKGYAFLLFILPVVDKANLNFQTNEPIIHVGRSLLLDFLKVHLSKFVLPSVVKNVESLKNIDYNSLKNQRSDEDLVIGNSTKKIIADLKP